MLSNPAPESSLRPCSCQHGVSKGAHVSGPVSLLTARAASFCLVSPPYAPFLVPELGPGYTESTHTPTPNAQAVLGKETQNPSDSQRHYPSGMPAAQRLRRILTESLNFSPQGTIISRG